MSREVRTIALMLFPAALVTDTQAPHWVASQLPPNAVPKRLEGIVYPEKEHAPPARLPP